jgi:hypothetical protein
MKKNLAYVVFSPLIRLWIVFEKVWINIKTFVKGLFAKRTTVGEFSAIHKYDNKKKLIKQICNITGLINKNPGFIDPEFHAELRSMGKKALLKTLVILNIAYTKKLEGKDADRKRK